MSGNKRDLSSIFAQISTDKDKMYAKETKSAEAPAEA